MERLAVCVVVVGLVGRRTRTHIQLPRRAVAVGEEGGVFFISKRRVVVYLILMLDAGVFPSASARKL